MEKKKVIFVVIVTALISMNIVISNSVWLSCRSTKIKSTSEYGVNYAATKAEVGIASTENVSTNNDIAVISYANNGFFTHLKRLKERKAREEGLISDKNKSSTSKYNSNGVNHTSLPEQHTVITTKVDLPQPGTPIVLEWSNFYGLSLFEDQKSLNEHCPFRCTYSTNRSRVDDAAVTIHHMGIFTYNAPIQTSKNQSFINIFLNFEPPPHRQRYKKSKARFFDATITYRQDSTIPIYHDSLVPLDGPNDTDRWSDAEVAAAIKLKQKTALWMVSHCATPSEREIYVDALREHMNITQIGKCNKKKCPMFEDCEQKLIKTHYFYIAFENSVCLDYITEKFFRLRQLIVPIVLDRRVFRGIHKRLLNYTIVASDFESPKHLAEHLHYLIVHPDEYRKYFEWTKIYKKSPQPFFTNEAACKVCKIAHRAQNGTFVKRKLAIQKWWGGNICYDHVGSALAFHNRSLDTFWNGL